MTLIMTPKVFQVKPFAAFHAGSHPGSHPGSPCLAHTGGHVVRVGAKQSDERVSEWVQELMAGEVNQ